VVRQRSCDLPVDHVGDDGTVEYRSVRRRKGKYVDADGFENDIIEEVNR
jgi:hypothetical protein